MKHAPSPDDSLEASAPAPNPDSSQTRHPLASRTLAELQTIANDAEAGGYRLNRSDWTAFDWLCLVQIVLTLRQQPPWTDAAILAISSTGEVPGGSPPL